MIAFLVAAICVLIIQILSRPRYTASSTPETATIAEISQSEAIPAMPETQPAETQEETQSQASHGKASTKVNIRELPSQDARVLHTIEEGTEFDIIEILDSGWAKVRYEEQEGYISSSYVIVMQS